MNMKPGRPRPRRGRGGFTLVELLVVIGIIAVLMSILIPSLARAREQARETQCMSNLRQWGFALSMYADENKQMIPADSGDGTSSSPVGKWDDRSLWFNALPPYLNASPYGDVNRAGRRRPGPGDASVYVCPSVSSIAGAPGDPVHGDFYTIYGLNSTGGKDARPMLLSYVMNSKLLNSTDKGLKITKLSPSSAWVVLVEMRERPGELKTTDANYSKTLAQLHSDRKRFAARHHGSVNRGGHLLFADSHVEFASNKEVNTPNPGAKTTDYNYPDVRMWDTHGAAQ